MSREATFLDGQSILIQDNTEWVWLDGASGILPRDVSAATFIEERVVIGSVGDAVVIRPFRVGEVNDMVIIKRS